ncbi:MAG TPA: EAL domain-containing protein [Solirubrobacteraceae bacterium]|jgi:diguanylate cyclase (GGDEF)-like protein/PAS domain S-box-containing protein|nr:EAL domain-containing protein [Solirubrobacteraceae bacterium]
MAGLHFTGATLAVGWLLAPHTGAADPTGVTVAIATAFAIAFLLLAGADRIPAGALRLLLTFTIAVVITGAVYFGHSTASAFGLFYLWATLYAYYFFSLREACLLNVLVAVSYGVVVLVLVGDRLSTEDVARWALTVATAAISGALVRILTQGSERSERRFRHGLKVSSMGTALLDEQGHLEQANPALTSLLGFSEHELGGLDLLSLIAPDDRAALAIQLQRLGSGSTRSVQFEGALTGQDGQPIPVGLTLSQLGDTRPVQLLVQVQDLSERQAAERILRASETRYRLLFERNPQPMWVFENDSLRFLAVNQAAIRTYGYSEQEFLGMTIRDIRPAEDIPRLLGSLGSTRSDVEHNDVWHHRRKDGTLMEVEVVSEALDFDGRPGRLVTAMDITARREAERELRRRADHDDLTGLLNRRHFEDLTRRQVQRDLINHTTCALLVLDLDHFKFVNDSFGHSVGDKLIQRVGESLRGSLRPTDLIARLGGDEFAVLLPRTDLDGATAVAGLLIERLRSKVWQGMRPTTASIGVAFLDGESCTSATDLMVAADVALYEAKEAGRNRFAVSSGRRGLTWMEEIRRAIDEQRLVLYSQPILDLRTGEIAQEELLLRMIDEQGEIIPPGAFIPTAERFGLIQELDRWVVERGLELVRQGRKVEVNLSAHSIGDRELTRMVGDALRDEPSPENLVFEITETAAAANFADVRDFAERISRLGCGFALDDFGTGFGAFSYLKHVPVSYLKIDMDFVRELPANPADQRVVRAIVSIAEGLGQKTIAEGVENAETLELLREMGVHYAQGFHIGRPAPLEQDQPSRLTSS